MKNLEFAPINWLKHMTEDYETAYIMTNIESIKLHQLLVASPPYLAADKMEVEERGRALHKQKLRDLRDELNGMDLG